MSSLFLLPLLMVTICTFSVSIILTNNYTDHGTNIVKQCDLPIMVTHIAKHHL